jgi:hypothetical protein
MQRIGRDLAALIFVSLAGLGCSSSTHHDAKTTDANTGSGSAGATLASGVAGANGAAASVGAAGSSAASGGSGAGASGRASAGGTGGSAANGGGGARAAGSGGSAASGAGGSDPGTSAGEDLFAAPDGKDGAPGTLAEPTTLTSAITRIGAGHAIRLRAGSYAYDVQITIEAGNSGSAGQLKQMLAYQDEKPVLDFSAQPYGTGSNPRGLQINGDYWHVKGLTVQGSADNGIYVAGNDNVIEGCVTHDNRDTGLQIGRVSSSAATITEWPSNNLILDCESYDNYDAPPGTGENADGFAAKLTVGPGNVFRGCVSHHNIDDGWDLYTKSDTGAIGTVTIDQCIAHDNGKLTNGMSSANGDGNGFKLGGDKIAVTHVVTRSIAFANAKDGFTWNSNPGALQLSNNLGFDNGSANFRFGDNSTTTEAVFTNNVSFRSAGGGDNDKSVGSDVANSNCWWVGASQNGKFLSVSSADFASPLTSAAIRRNADGSLDLAPFQLAPDSDLINAGVMPAGALPFDATYYLGLPDLGAVEAR